MPRHSDRVTPAAVAVATSRHSTNGRSSAATVQKIQDHLLKTSGFKHSTMSIVRRSVELYAESLGIDVPGGKGKKS